jgi:hypothetical protein
MTLSSSLELVPNAITTLSNDIIISWEVPEDADPEKPMNW